MKYKALKNCKFDRRYSVGEFIDESVIDKQCLPRAVKFGYIAMANSAEEVELVEEVKAEEESVEAQEAPESDSAEEVEEEPQQKQKGRRKADREA